MSGRRPRSTRRRDWASGHPTLSSRFFHPSARTRPRLVPEAILSAGWPIIVSNPRWPVGYNADGSVRRGPALTRYHPRDTSPPTNTHADRSAPGDDEQPPANQHDKPAKKPPFPKPPRRQNPPTEAPNLENRHPVNQNNPAAKNPPTEAQTWKIAILLTKTTRPPTPCGRRFRGVVVARILHKRRASPPANDASSRPATTARIS